MYVIFSIYGLTLNLWDIKRITEIHLGGKSSEDRAIGDERPRSCSGKRIRRLWKQKPHSNKRGGLSIVWWEEEEMTQS